MTWTTQNKRLPGAYVNFKARKEQKALVSGEGIPALMLQGQTLAAPGFHTVAQGTDLAKLFGTTAKIAYVAEALAVASKVLVYVPASTGGTKATGTEGGLTVTAVKEGAEGNKLVVNIINNGPNMIVTTILDNNQVDSQEVAASQLPAANDYVTFSGTLPSSGGSTTQITLSGGADGSIDNSVDKFIAELSKQDFRVVAYGTDTADDKKKLVAAVKEWRNEGRAIVAVINNYADANNEGVISVDNGVTLADGTKLTSKEAIYRVAALSATAGSKSLTHAEYVGAIDCDAKTPQEIAQTIEKGNIVFRMFRGRVLIAQDVNTLVTPADGQNDDFKKNKLVRTMDIIGEAIQAVFVENFVGQVVNDIDGRELFKQHLIVRVLDPLVAQSALTYSADDIKVTEGSQKEAILVTLGVKLADAMEKLYVTVEVK